MASAIHRIAPYEFLETVNTPDYSPPITSDWLINPDFSGVEGVPWKYRKVVSDTVVEMNQAEKDAVDAALLEDQIDFIMKYIRSPVNNFSKFDDFVGPNPWNRWAQDKVGANSTVVAVHADCGQIMIRAGNNSNDYATLTSGMYNFKSAHNLALQVGFRLDHTSDMISYLGFWKDWSSKVEFRATGGYWYTTCSNGGNHTVTQSAVALDTNQHAFEIELSEIKAVFKIDGEIVGTHTENLPIDLMYFRVQMVNDGGAVVRDSYCDFVSINGQRT